MFFQEFFTVFTNDYADTSDIVQTAQIYVGQNALYSAYLGNESLAQGVQPTPPSMQITLTWIIILSVIVFLLLALLLFACYWWRKNNKEIEAEEREKILKQENE
jgi:hypothetical protein